MTTMAQIELDSVKPSNFSAIDKFYESNLSAIVRLDSPSPSIVTCSSKSSKSKTKRCIDESDGSTCASDSEPEELNAIRLKDQFLKYHQQDSCQSKPSNQLFSKDGNLNVLVNHNVGDTDHSASSTKIESVAIQNSTDIQFGNKTFYNGPVFIKQFIRDENKRWISSQNVIEKAQIGSGVENKGFDGED